MTEALNAVSNLNGLAAATCRPHAGCVKIKSDGRSVPAQRSDLRGHYCRTICLAVTVPPVPRPTYPIGVMNVHGILAAIWM